MKNKKLLPLIMFSSVVAPVVGCGKQVVDENTLVVTCVELGYGVEWLRQLAKTYTEQTGVKFKFTFIPGENGIGQIDSQIKSYAGTSDIYGSRPSKFHNYIYRGQITDASGNVQPGVFEDLTDIYNSTYEGETGKNTMALKMDKSFQEYVTVKNKSYAVPWANGFVSFVRNLDVWEKFGYSKDYYPKTTDEMFEVFDSMNTKIHENPSKYNNVAPMIFSEGSEYYTTITGSWFAQYEGSDNMENYYAGLDPDGDTSDNYFTYQGISESGDVLAKLLKKNGSSYVYQHKDSDSSFTDVQDFFLFGAAAFMVNGTWLEVESSLARNSNLDWIKIPLVSSITNKLSIKNSTNKEEKLRELVAYVDEHLDDGDYTNMPSGVTEGDVDIVRDARKTGSVMRTDYDHLFVVPTWNHKKEMAKSFLKWMYSDGALQQFYNIMNGHHLPATLSQGDYSNEGVTISQFRRASEAILKEGNFCPYLVNTVKPRIFSVAGVLANFSNSSNYLNSCVDWLRRGQVATGEDIRKENSSWIKANWDRISKDL